LDALADVKFNRESWIYNSGDGCGSRWTSDLSTPRVDMSLVRTRYDPICAHPVHCPRPAHGVLVDEFAVKSGCDDHAQVPVPVDKPFDTDPLKDRPSRRSAPRHVPARFRRRPLSLAPRFRTACRVDTRKPGQ